MLQKIFKLNSMNNDFYIKKKKKNEKRKNHEIKYENALYQNLNILLVVTFTKTSSTLQLKKDAATWQR